MMDHSGHSSFSSVVSAITLDEAIRASSHRRLMDIESAGSRRGGGDGFSSRTAHGNIRSTKDPPSQRRVYMNLSGRSSGSISTIKMDEEDNSSFAGINDPVFFHSEEKGAHHAASVDDDGYNHHHIISRFDMVCPRRGTDQMLKQPRHDLFDDEKQEEAEDAAACDSDDDDESDIESDSGHMDHHDFQQNPMLSKSLPSSTTRPWSMEERSRISRTGSGDMAPTLPRHGRCRPLVHSSRHWVERKCQIKLAKDTAPTKPRSRSLDYDSSTNEMYSHQNHVDLKRFISTNVPLSKPIRHNDPEAFNAYKQRHEQLSLDNLKVIRASILPLAVPVRQKSGPRSQPRRGTKQKQNDSTTDERTPSDHFETFETIGHHLTTSVVGPKAVPSKAYGAYGSLAAALMQGDARVAMASPIRRRRVRTLGVQGERRRSLGPLCTVSSPISWEPSTQSNIGAHSFKRSHLEMVPMPSFGVSDDYGRSELVILNGDECYPSVSKKIRRHSTPWLSSSSNPKAGLICVDAVQEKIEAIARFGVSKTPNGPSPPPTPPVPPSSPTVVITGGSLGTSKPKLNVSCVHQRKRSGSSSRFDPMAGSSSHSRDMLTMVKPPKRQDSNHDLVGLPFDGHSSLSNAEKAMSCNYNFMPFSPSMGASPPKMPKRKSSYNDLRIEDEVE